LPDSELAFVMDRLDLEAPAEPVSGGSSLLVHVHGQPRPQPRPRLIPMKGGKARVVSTADPKAKLWRDAVQEAFRLALEGRKEWAGMVDEPGASVVLTAFFRLAHRRSANGTRSAREDKGAKRHGAMVAHTAKPDLDNLMKLVMDAAQDAGVFGNGADPDAKVAGVHATKVWAEPGAGLMPGVCVTVSCVHFSG